MNVDDHGDREYLALLMASLFGLAAALANPIVGKTVLYSLAALLLARFILVLAWRRTVTVDLLMGVVGLVTGYHGAVMEGLVVLALYGLAEVVEDLVVGRARRAVEGLARLIPSRVLVVRGGELVEVDPREIVPGDVLVARVGEALPVDGVALSPGSLDLSVVTGEHVPRRIRPGEHVPSGAIVLEGPVRVRATGTLDDSYVQRIVRAAQEALEKKSGVQRLVERAAGPLTVAVLGAYVLASSFFGSLPGLAVLLAGCPSAYIIGSAVATSLSVAGLAGRGVLVRDPVVFEKALLADTVVLDKTGTLTRPRARLVTVETHDSVGASGFLGQVLAVARQSRHPVAVAVAEALEEAGVAPKPLDVSAVELVGRGMSSTGLSIRPGGPVGECPKTVVVEAESGRAVFCLVEEVVPGAREIVGELRGMGLRVVLASGDSRESVERVARLLGIEEYYHDMKPGDKARLVSRLQDEGRRVIFVGDGVNDAPALATAWVGVAVGGVEVARESADVVSVSGLQGLSWLLRASKAYNRSLVASFATVSVVKGSVMVAGLAGAPLPLVALLGDDGSTLLGAGIVYALVRAVGLER